MSVNWNAARAASASSSTAESNDWGMAGPGSGGKSLPHIFAIIFGAVCLLLGVVGFFITGFSEFTERKDALLLGIFHLTPMYNVALIGIGGLWLLCAFTLTRAGILGVNFAMGGFFLVGAILAFLGALPLFGIPAGVTPDAVLLLVLGVVSAVFGVLPAGD